MRVKIGQESYKISFKHVSRFLSEELDSKGRKKEILLPATNFGLGGKKNFRGMTMCFISLMNDKGEPQLIAEGIALCDEQDLYRAQRCHAPKLGLVERPSSLFVFQTKIIFSG